MTGNAENDNDKHLKTLHQTVSEYALEGVKLRCDFTDEAKVTRTTQEYLKTTDDCYTACKQTDYFTYHIKGYPKSDCNDSGCYCACYEGPCDLVYGPKVNVYKIIK